MLCQFLAPSRICGGNNELTSEPILLLRALKNSVVFIDDGMLKFAVTEIGSDYVLVRAANGGMLGSRKGVNLPDAAIDLPPLSPKDVGMGTS